MQFPDKLRVCLGSKHGCPRCEARFDLAEFKPNGKKSRTWTLGLISFGTKEPMGCEAFLVKCPNCNQPVQAIIISPAEPLGKVEPPKEEEEKLEEKPAEQKIFSALPQRRRERAPKEEALPQLPKKGEDDEC